jgi:D-amino-acid dehydrogenase
VKLTRLDAEQLARVEPAFARSTVQLAGAIHSPDDASGNSELFSRELRARCEQLGVEFRFGVTAEKFTQERGRITGLVTDQGVLTADAYVLALGVGSPFLSRSVGQDIPVYPAKGFSVTVDIADKATAPELGGVDEKTLVAWSPMGDRMRMSSTAQFSGYDRSWKPSDFDNITDTANTLWPGALNWDTVRLTAGLRPMTPDGPPVIGKGSKHSNLFYNTGHGHMGWTMSCGSSAILADIVAGRTPEIDTTAFAVRSIRK